MRDILGYLWRMAPAALYGTAVYWCVRPARLRRLKRLGYTSGRGREMALALFIVVLAGLLRLTVVPALAWDGTRLVLLAEGYGEINLQPFLIFKQSRYLSQQGVRNYFLINFWGNIAMFLPIGFFPALLWRRGRWWKALLTGAGLSLLIELCQIPISRGTDIDDLWLNTLGAMLGYGLLRLVAWLAPEGVKKYKVGEDLRWT